jgi:hypothetical protein
MNSVKLKCLSYLCFPLYLKLYMTFYFLIYYFYYISRHTVILVYNKSYISKSLSMLQFRMGLMGFRMRLNSSLFILIQMRFCVHWQL